MKAIHLAITIPALAMAPLSAPHLLAQEAMPRAVQIVQAEFLELRYSLPAGMPGKSTAARWGMAAPVIGGVSDPNAIVYDQAYMEKYVHWAVTTPIADGGASYVVVTPQGETKIESGLDAAYLGERFAAVDLVKFLDARVQGKRVERKFRVENAEAVKVLREYPESTAAKRLRESPWDQDTRTVIELLGLARYAPAHPQLTALAKDANRDVRYAAIIALGRIAPQAPQAIDDLEKLLDDKNARGDAATALALAGEKATAALIRGLDHPDRAARNHIVYGVASRAEAKVAAVVLQRALPHRDAELRSWAVAAIGDLISRAGPESGKPYVAGLAARLTDDPQENTRQSAALALLNMKEHAAPAEAALRQAAEKDADHHVRDRAQQALEQLKPKKGEKKGT